MLELLQTPLSETLIKMIPDVEQKPFILIVDRILEITKGDDYFTNKNKQALVLEYEKQLDLLVYKLYGLTDDEIAVVKKSANYDRKAEIDDEKEI